MNLRSKLDAELPGIAARCMRARPQPETPDEERRVEPEPDTSLAYLQTVYRNPDIPLPVRMRAAGMALPFESPKLAVIATLCPTHGIGERLERAIARSLQAGTVIEGRATEVAPNPEGEPVRLPVASPPGPGVQAPHLGHAPSAALPLS